jgi:hypothetical protein
VPVCKRCDAAYLDGESHYCDGKRHRETPLNETGRPLLLAPIGGMIAIVAPGLVLASPTSGRAWWGRRTPT